MLACLYPDGHMRVRALAKARLIQLTV